MIPKLISVVEIVKREYIKVLEQQRSIRLEGLYQYNEIGNLEDLGLVPEESELNARRNGGEEIENVEERAKRIQDALSGKNQSES
jgi:hypothetical protein